MRRLVGVFLMGLILNGCASTGARQMKNIHPEWNPQNGMVESEERCRTSSKYAVAPTNAYMVCMAAYGYELRTVKP